MHIGLRTLLVIFLLFASTLVSSGDSYFFNSMSYTISAEIVEGSEGTAIVEIWMGSVICKEVEISTKKFSQYGYTQFMRIGSEVHPNIHVKAVEGCPEIRIRQQLNYMIDERVTRSCV